MIRIRATRACAWALLVVGWSLPADLQGQDAVLDPSADLGTIRCTATATAPLVRAGGASELAGDIVITCNNVAPVDGFSQRGFFQADVALSYNVGSANPVVLGDDTNVTDAVMIVNDMHCQGPSPEANFADCGARQATVQGPMLARRHANDARAVIWQDMAFPIPGAAIPVGPEPAEAVLDCTGRYGVAGGCHPRTTQLRLTNLRVDATDLGGVGSAPVMAYLSINSREASVVLESAPLEIARTAPALRVSSSVRDADRLCSHGETYLDVVVTEGFAYAFKARGSQRQRVGDPGWMDGIYLDLLNPATAFYRVAPTRLQVTLEGVPDNVDVQAPSAVACRVLGRSQRQFLGLVADADARGMGGEATEFSGALQTLGRGADGTRSVVYEVLTTDPLLAETCEIPLRLSAPTRSRGEIRDATASLEARLMPAGARSDPDFGVSGLRFVASGVAPSSSFRINSCGTFLFFPFITNRGSFDTVVVISNTSSDPLGSRHQAGRCRLQYRGSGVAGQTAPEAVTTVEIQAGQRLAYTLSIGNPSIGVGPVMDFQGYLVADCSFQHAHGFAFVTEAVGGTSVLAQGYLAEIVSGDPATTSEGE